MTFLIGKKLLSSQPMAGGRYLELFHAKQADDPSSIAVLVTVNSFEVIDEFMKTL